MALGEEECWVPPMRKFSGVPSLATFRRTALTPWNSQDSSSGSGSPPDSPRHALFQDTSKVNTNQAKDPIDTNTSVRSNDASSKQTAVKEDDGLRIDRIFKMNSKNHLDRRRIKSSEPLVGRGRNPNLKLANRTDGRDSIRLKNKGKFRKTNNKQNTRNTKSMGETSYQIKMELTKPKNHTPTDNVSSDNKRNNEINDSNKNPTIEVTESINDLNTNREVNCDTQRRTKDRCDRESSSERIPSDNETGTNLNVKKKNDSDRISLVNGYRTKNSRSASLASQRSLSPSSPTNVNRTKNNSAESSRTSSRLGIRKSRSILEVQVIEPVEQNEIEQVIPVGFETNYNKKELEDNPDSSSSESQDESDDLVKEEEKRKRIDVTSDDKAEDQGDTSSDDKTDNDSDDSDKKDELDVGETDDKCGKVKNKKDAIEVPTPKAQSSPQQILRIHGITLTKDKLKKLRSIVDKAAQRKKVFTIFGKYPSIREALVSRGWVQNFDLQKLSLPHTRQNDNEVSVYAKLRLGTGVGEEELALISRMLRDTPVHFVWIMGDTVDWKSLSKSTIVSRFPRVYFTTKVGLCSYLEESHWFCEASVSHVNFPRCYTTDDLGSFVKDFRLTACLGLIRTLIMAVDNNQPNIFSGKIPLSAIKFAVKRCSELVSVEEHEDIDMDSEERVWDHQWDQFLTYYYQLVHEGETFVPATDPQIKALHACCQAALEGVKPYWPQLELDGLSNLWLVKPGAKSRGRGISVCNKIERIMAKLGSSNQPSTDMNPPACSSRFVIQKYVERPLLIHNTKFDIRQWFLVTSAYPLTIWMYKESYLRFCSQLFSLSNLHESVHLTNNAVQCRYRNQNKRDKALPDENMWDSYTFQAYLRTLGRRDEWESVVYPGMRESITGALLAAQDHMEARPNCFELYGADFILTEDLKPWLIEINSSPAMSATTSVTARMCPQCLEDIIKVVIDRRSNRDAPTGQFELIYRQNVSTPQPYMGMNLTVRGSPAPRGKVPPPSWQSADGIQPTSHHTNIETALNSLADHLVTIT